MTESQFIKENKEDWKELEELLVSKDTDPDRLQALFVKVSGDLSYARTFYPHRAVRQYLNSLLSGVFDSLRSGKKRGIWERVQHFYSHTLPSEIITNKNAFIISFTIFALAVAIGAFSSFQDDEFLRQILGDSYVAMTEKNIQNDDPLAVYKSQDKAGMFLGITINNIKVAFFAFVLGIFASVGTFFLLISNGIMLGAFQTFFYQKGLFLTSFLTIWIHGTIEISSIIVAGAAGIIMGNGLLFPGTYTRSVAIREAAVRALIILLSTVPLFIVAGFLEGFVTRHTELPTVVKAGIIIVSLVFIIIIYVVHPYRYYKSGKYKKNAIYIDNENSTSKINFHMVSEKASVDIRSKFGVIFGQLIIPSLAAFAGIFYLIIFSNQEYLINIDTHTLIGQPMFNDTYFLTPLVFVSLVVLGMLFFMKLGMILYSTRYSWRDTFLQLIKQPVPLFLVASVVVLSLFYLPLWGILLFLFVFPYTAFARTLKDMIEIDDYKLGMMLSSISISYKYWVSFLLNIALIAFLFLIVSIINTSSISYILNEYLSWHELFEYNILQNIFYKGVLSFLFGSLVVVFSVAIFNHQWDKSENDSYAYDLIERYRQFSKEKLAK